MHPSLLLPLLKRPQRKTRSRLGPHFAKPIWIQVPSICVSLSPIQNDIGTSEVRQHRTHVLLSME